MIRFAAIIGLVLLLSYSFPNASILEASLVLLAGWVAWNSLHVVLLVLAAYGAFCLLK